MLLHLDNQILVSVLPFPGDTDGTQNGWKGAAAEININNRPDHLYDFALVHVRPFDGKNYSWLGSKIAETQKYEESGQESTIPVERADSCSDSRSTLEPADRGKIRLAAQPTTPLSGTTTAVLASVVGCRLADPW
jgi:hypothetical protein